LTGLHLIREPLGTSSLKEGETGAVGEYSPREPNHMEGRRGQSQMSKAQPSDKKKWRQACRLFETNNLKEEAVWHVEPLLGNDSETSKYTTVTAKSMPTFNKNGGRCN
jgi:hypothetical protein